jgi:phage-related holin
LIGWLVACLLARVGSYCWDSLQMLLLLLLLLLAVCVSGSLRTKILREIKENMGWCESK